MAETDQPDLTSLTVNLLSAYFANNSVDSAALPGMIQTTHDALKNLSTPPQDDEVAPAFVPAVTVRKSLGSPAHILSMIDGKPYKMLKRHLAGHGLTPAEYRDRYKLAKDYPMVAKAYSEQRRAVAQTLGLGRKVRQVDPALTSTPEAVTPVSDVAADVAPAAPAEAKSPTHAKPKAKAAPKKAAPRKASPAALDAMPATAPAPTKMPAKPRRTKPAAPAAAETPAAPKPAIRASRKKKDVATPPGE